MAENSMLDIIARMTAQTVSKVREVCHETCTETAHTPPNPPLMIQQKQSRNRPSSTGCPSRISCASHGMWKCLPGILTHEPENVSNVKAIVKQAKNQITRKIIMIDFSDWLKHEKARRLDDFHICLRALHF